MDTSCSSASSTASCSKEPKAISPQQPLSLRAQRTPAKSAPLVVPISEATRAILKRRTGQEYLTSEDLPPQAKACLLYRTNNST
mmetsp:Transcript_49737/g.125017  ORF Transcript_49737/g.125017 Transcript_49737/m.125017 type:complete len:84 (-) Transcript_49737:62-313(-)